MGRIRTNGREMDYRKRLPPATDRIALSSERKTILSVKGPLRNGRPRYLRRTVFSLPPPIVSHGKIELLHGQYRAR